MHVLRFEKKKERINEWFLINSLFRNFSWKRNILLSRDEVLIDLSIYRIPLSILEFNDSPVRPRRRRRNIFFDPVLIIPFD